SSSVRLVPSSRSTSCCSCCVHGTGARPHIVLSASAYPSGAVRSASAVADEEADGALSVAAGVPGSVASVSSEGGVLDGLGEAGRVTLSTGPGAGAAVGPEPLPPNATVTRMPTRGMAMPPTHQAHRGGSVRGG